ncbi:MAG: RuvX/YqgF family protein [Fervidobacterium sp.]|uniref:RuvX/YqgF family protein n=1 Tax=Fervidobacterium sp. TaxID=1871331 RepID=UPI00404A43E6
MSILAIDFGKSKCGYAIGTLFVSESGTVKTSEIIEKTKRFEKIVVGLPLSMSGNYSTQTFEAIKFALKLKKMGKSIFFIDERMTTRMAKTFSKTDDDRFSAEQLLLEYLNNPSNSIEFKLSRLELEEEMSYETVLFIEVPFSDRITFENALVYSKDPYIAYTHFETGSFVYRVWKDLNDKIKTLEKKPDLVIINKDCRQLLSNLEFSSDVLLVDVKYE